MKRRCIALLVLAGSALAIAVPLAAAQSPREQQYNQGAQIVPAPAAQPTSTVEVTPVTEESPAAEETTGEEEEAPVGQPAEEAEGVAPATTQAVRSFLPFTGLHLGLAVAGGIALAAAGLGFRRLGRQRAD